jgi:hypothetical protein
MTRPASRHVTTPDPPLYRRHRLAAMTAAGARLVVAVTAGIVAVGSLMWTWVTYCATILAAATMDEALSLAPPCPAFFVLIVGGGLTIGAVHVLLGMCCRLSRSAL